MTRKLNQLIENIKKHSLYVDWDDYAEHYCIFWDGKDYAYIYKDGKCTRGDDADLFELSPEAHQSIDAFIEYLKNREKLSAEYCRYLLCRDNMKYQYLMDIPLEVPLEDIQTENTDRVGEVIFQPAEDDHDLHQWLDDAKTDVLDVVLIPTEQYVHLLDILRKYENMT